MKLEIKAYLRTTFQGCTLSEYKLIPDGTTKAKLAVLAFLYCGEFVKNFCLLLDYLLK